MAYPRSRHSRAHKFFNRTAGNLTLNSTTWADLPTIGTTWDATLQAQAGDTIEAALIGVWGAEAVQVHLDVATIVSAAVVNYFGTGTAGGAGVPGWLGASGDTANFGGSAMRTLVAGDISTTTSTVTLRPRYRTSTAANKTLYAGADLLFQFWVKNLGPPSPY